MELANRCAALSSNIIRLPFLIDFQFYSSLFLGIPGIFINIIFFVMIFKRGTYLTRNLKILLSTHVTCSLILLANTFFLAVRAFMSRDDPCQLITEAYMCRVYSTCFSFAVSLTFALLVCIAVERFYLAKVYKNFDNRRYNMHTVVVVILMSLLLFLLQVQVKFDSILYKLLW